MFTKSNMNDSNGKIGLRKKEMFKVYPIHLQNWFFKRNLDSLFSQTEEWYVWNQSNFQNVDDQGTEGKRFFQIFAHCS